MSASASLPRLRGRNSADEDRRSRIQAYVASVVLHVLVVGAAVTAQFVDPPKLHKPKPISVQIVRLPPPKPVEVAPPPPKPPEPVLVAAAPPPPKPIEIPKPVPVAKPKPAVVAPKPKPAAPKPKIVVPKPAPVRAPAPVEPPRAARAERPQQALAAEKPKLGIKIDAPKAPNAALPDEGVRGARQLVAQAKPQARALPRPDRIVQPVDELVDDDAPVERAQRSTRPTQVKPPPGVRPAPAIPAAAAPDATLSGPSPSVARVDPRAPTRAAPPSKVSRPSNPVAFGQPSAPSDTAPARDARAERQAPVREREYAAPRPDHGIRGIPLSQLAACRSDKLEDLLKQKVLAAVSNRRECRSAAGVWHFVETKNLNAFLLWIERAPNRPEADRCDELGFALDCLRQSAAVRGEPR